MLEIYEEDDFPIEDNVVPLTLESLATEIKRGAVMQRSLFNENDFSQRVFNTEEKRCLPVEGRDYLLSLEKSGDITSLEREWIIESVLYTIDKESMPEASLSLIVATAFIVRRIQKSIFDDKSTSLIINDFYEISGRIH